MKIHELAEKAGLTAETIRYYEKEGLLDRRHVTRDGNNYRNYSGEAAERLALIRKLQSVGFSLGELRETLTEPNEDPAGNQRVIGRIHAKIEEFKQKMAEYDHILATLTWMLEYRVALQVDPKKAELLMEQWKAQRAAYSKGQGRRTARNADSRSTTASSRQAPRR